MKALYAGAPNGICSNCGEALEGDGANTVLHCPNANEDDLQVEADAPAVNCTMNLEGF